MSLSLIRVRGSRFMVGLVIVALVSGVSAKADELRDLMEQALDQPIDELVIDNAPLPDAFDQIEARTGVRITITPAALDKMPYGGRTQVSLEIRDLTLRQGLRQLLAGLGLQMSVAADAVQVEPGPVLDRVPGRLSLAEVNLLARLAEMKPSDFSDAIPARVAGLLRLEKAVSSVSAGNALEALEFVTQTHDFAWYPDEGTVVVKPKVAIVRQKLTRTLPMDYHQVPLDELLIDLGQRIGVVMHFQPGVLQRIDARDRVADVIQRDVSVLQTLERIAGNTGLDFEVKGDGVHFSLPERPGRAVAETPRFIRLDIPIGGSDATVAYIIREEDLPPALRQELEQQLAETLADLAAQASGATAP
jgi:hypothetical protein